MDAIDTSMTARASNALFNQVMREQQTFPSFGSGDAAPPLSPGDLISVSPPGPYASSQDFDSFIQKLIEAKREALRRAARRGGGPRPTDPERPGQNQTGPIDVKAHGFHEGDKFVPVREIRIYEVNDYSHRTYQTFSGGYPEYSWRMNDARVGKSYKVKVSWANGYTETRDVRMNSSSGASLDIYRY